MITSEREEAKQSLCRCQSCLSMVLGAVLLLPLTSSGLFAANAGVEHYKMISTVEYAGEGQFRNRAETLYTVKQQTLPDGRVQYSFSGRNDTAASDQESPLRTFEFVLDRETRRVSGVERDMALWARVNNECVRSLQKVTKDNVGRTWKQSFALSSFDASLPGELVFTLTAIELETDEFGQMIAVRALSEPFFARADKGSVRCKINTIYLFDPEIEEIYLSISTFRATTNANGHKETLCHEVATYKSSATGASVDLSGLGKDFAKFAQKVGLSRKAVKVAKETPLPEWAQSEGLVAAQVATMCGALACEGAPNPVLTVSMPIVQTLQMQSLGLIPPVVGMGGPQTVAGVLGQSVPGIGAMNIAAAPAWANIGWNWPTAAWGAGLGVGAAAAGGAFSSGGSSYRSPSVP